MEERENWDRTKLRQEFDEWLLAMSRAVERMRRCRNAKVLMNEQSPSMIQVVFDGETRRWEVDVGEEAEWMMCDDLRRVWEAMVGGKGMQVSVYGSSPPPATRPPTQLHPAQLVQSV
ncbi:hypothetical protein K440DRAFT_636281 [Wilcoxina mikolae CBS 423.85]|nr:hypothetical protein K440DRAFT_636281 [Wilcoxina mikolae CBS 423.85]